MEDVIYDTKLMERRQLSDNTFEAIFSRPAGFEFTAGQRIRLIHGGLERDYSLANAPDEAVLVICIRRVTTGRFSTLLSTIPVGTGFTFSGPHGYFVFRASARSPVFVATGTGVAPFTVRQAGDCYYATLFRTKARRYVVCLSEEDPSVAGMFHGRVTDYIASQLEPDRYDFYLCGRGEMIRDVTWLVDDRFPGSMVYTEIFY
ncbi:MAG: FAD-binding oxidoreductase [Desulfobacterales bacterium]